MNLIDYIRSQTTIPEKGIINTLELLQKDATIPFIARYRKERTGNLDEVDIEKIFDLTRNYEDLEKRKASILKSIEEQGKLTESLNNQITGTYSLAQLEDLYLPYKRKRKTKANAAIEAGLEPLANLIFSQTSENINITAKRFIAPKVKNVSEAIEGAKYIIAERVNEHKEVREKLRKLYSRKATLSSKLKTTEIDNIKSNKYSQYFDWNEPLSRAPSHRFLAIHRAKNEGILKIKVVVEKEQALALLKQVFIRNERSPSAKYLSEAIEYSFTRLLKPSFQKEFLSEAKAKADDNAIAVFAGNLEQLLLSPPLGEKRIIAIDPGFRSGCKVVCLDENGLLLHNENIYPHSPQKEELLAMKKIRSLVNAYNIEAISIGNGTASRETETFIKKIKFDRKLLVYVVNEAGASVYSASKIARDEFPNYDVTVRGAVSIGRRLNDPLAELVKIDPKSIGVGQYQHEVDQGKLKEKLDTVVMSCVNRIGVNVNTASKELLSYVSGIGPSLAEKIIEYRNNNGALGSRRELLKIQRLGDKAFEQCAGFLRIKGGEEALDDSGVHPESYHIVEKIAKDKNLKIGEVIGNKEFLKELQINNYVSEEVGMLTLKDILKELEKPGADPRKVISSFNFDPHVRNIEDLRIGMELPGIVNNITNFGCFVDIGIKESGLIHISNLAKGYVSDPNSIVKLNQQIEVTVIEIEIKRKRIQLSLKN